MTFYAKRLLYYVCQWHRPKRKRGTSKADYRRQWIDHGAAYLNNWLPEWRTLRGDSIHGRY